MGVNGLPNSKSSFLLRQATSCSVCSITKMAPLVHLVRYAQNIDVSQDTLDVETAISRSKGVLASGLPQSRHDDPETQDEVSTMPLTDESTLGERQPFDQWLEKLHVHLLHYHYQQAPFTQKKNGWMVSQCGLELGRPNVNMVAELLYYLSYQKAITAPEIDR